MSYLAALIGAILGAALPSPLFWIAVAAVLALVWWRRGSK